MITNNQQELMHLFHQLVKEFGHLIIIKGAFSLMLNTEGKYPNIKKRITMDIDFYIQQHFDGFLETLQSATFTSPAGERYSFIKLRTPKKNSAGRVLATTSSIRIELDIQTDEYLEPILTTVGTLDVAITHPVSIVIDKLDAISKEKVINRPKDLYDLYVLSLVYNFNYIEIAQHHTFKIAGDFEFFIENWEAMERSYMLAEFMPIEHRPDFTALYTRVKEFASPFIVPEELLTPNLIWDSACGLWTKIRKDD